MKLGTETHDGLTQLLADLVSMATIHTHTIMGENYKICMYILTYTLSVEPYMEVCASKVYTAGNC